MAQHSILKTKSFDFAVRIIKLYKYLKTKFTVYELPGQLLRSGTAIGALLREAEFAESRTDFKHKLRIALKEANETVYWLNLLHSTNYIDNKMFNSINSDAEQLLKMLVSSIKTIESKTAKQ
jgi:four helix bundle protein